MVLWEKVLGGVFEWVLGGVAFMDDFGWNLWPPQGAFLKPALGF